MSKDAQTPAEARADLKREFWKVYEPPLLRMVEALNGFLLRHPMPRWLDRAMRPLDWLGRQQSRFIRWLFS